MKHTLVLLSLLLLAPACRDGTGPGGQPTPHLPGDPNAPAAGAIPEQPFVARAEDYADDHPELPGKYLSFNTLTLVFHTETTVVQANTLLDDFEAWIVGGIPGVPGSAAGILYLRFPTRSHPELEATLARLRAHPQVRHVARDVLVGTSVISRPNAGSPPTWAWELTPAGANWGLERIRVPQMWNLNAAVQKSGNTTAVGVLDVGFTASHPDLLPNVAFNLTPGIHHDHGTHVAGIIAAVHDNRLGVDGVNPFARLTLSAVPAPTGAEAVMASLLSWGVLQFNLYKLITHSSNVRVINLSLGHNWTPMNVNSATHRGAHAIVEAEADVLQQMLDIMQVLGRTLPLIVNSAGNDFGMPARFNGAAAYLSLVRNHPDIIVVEALANLEGAPGGATLSSFSNVGGTLSAPGGEFPPGEQVWSTMHTVAYGGDQGTSMAAPHVVGLASYLLALDPTLTNAELRTLLLGTRVAAGGGAALRIDAFAAARALDALRGDDRVLRLLVDIDDGTPDGNRRLNPDSSVNTADARGDGKVDMRDFRRWRDWLLQVENPAGLRLDGAADHPKKDLNGDSIFGTPAQENVYPRGDFNGDGVLSRTATRAVLGFPGTVTDLEVLQRLFDDEHYAAAELPGLLDSGDLEIDAGGCFSPGVAEVVSSIRVTGAPVAAQLRGHTPAAARQVYTAPVRPAGYTARVEAQDMAGRVLARAEEEFAISLGSDHSWRPSCSQLVVRLTFPDTIDVGAAAPLRVRVGHQPPGSGAFEPEAGAQVDLEVSSGSVAPKRGTTGVDGYFEAAVRVDEAVGVITVFATATGSQGDTVTAQAGAVVRPPPGEVGITPFEVWACEDRVFYSVGDQGISMSGSVESPSNRVCDASVTLRATREADGGIIIESTAQARRTHQLAVGAYWRVHFSMGDVPDDFEYTFQAGISGSQGRVVLFRGGAAGTEPTAATSLACAGLDAGVPGFPCPAAQTVVGILPASLGGGVPHNYTILFNARAPGGVTPTNVSFKLVLKRVQ